MKNKILSTIAISLLLITNAFAQDQKPVKIHEIGLTFASLDNFGIRYKTGNEKTLLRITILAMNINSNNAWGEEEDSIDIKNSGYGAGFRIGFEKPIPIVKNFNLFYGLDLIGDFNYQKIKQEERFYNYHNTSWSISSGLAFVFGGTCSLGDHFRFSAEISPSLRYAYQNNKTTTNGQPEVTTQSNNVGFGLGNYGANLTIAYRIIK